MHDHELSSYTHNWLRISCCKGIAVYPVRLMIERHGNARLGDVLNRLRCKKCGQPPQSVWLQETHWTEDYAGSPAGWAVQLMGT